MALAQRNPPPNEIRRLENLPEIDGGNEYLSPLNMQRIGEGRGTDGRE